MNHRLQIGGHMQLERRIPPSDPLRRIKMATTTAKKKTTAKKPSARKYSPAASKSVETEMKAMKEGKLRSGKSGKKVTSRKQAIAIGLSKAREAGAKVPPAE
jgi:anti-sigma28 factor (negative regulator of flagellin synthesis)